MRQAVHEVACVSAGHAAHGVAQEDKVGVACSKSTKSTKSEHTQVEGNRSEYKREAEKKRK